MRTLAAACALLAVTAVPAAASHATNEGGCSHSFVAEPTETLGEGFEVVVDAEFVVYSPASLATPVSATVTCTLLHHQPDGSLRPYEFTFSGTTLVTGTGSVRLPADISPWDLGMCQTIRYDGDATTSHTCYDYLAVQIPPQAIHDAVAEVLAYVPGSHDAVCGATAGAAP